jgi:hypothetical protein
MVGQRLRQNDLTGNTVHLWLNGPEIGNFGAQKTFAQDTNDSHEIYLRSLKIMAKIGPEIPKIRALGVTCTNLLKVSYSPLLYEQKRREALIKTIDKINNKFGEHSIFPATIILTRKMQ